jgi:hypothetical protein
MRLHYLQHVPFEDPANIAVWAEKRGHSVSGTALYDGQQMPATSQFDWLVILGGPMVFTKSRAIPGWRRRKGSLPKPLPKKRLL